MEDERPADSLALRVFKGVESVTYQGHDGKAVPAIVGRVYRRTQALFTNEYVIAIHVTVSSHATIVTDSGRHHIPWFSIIEWFRRDGQ